MTKERLEYCRICKNRRFDFVDGIKCELTGKRVSFLDKGTCTNYEYDEKEDKRQITCNMDNINEILRQVNPRWLFEIQYVNNNNVTTWHIITDLVFNSKKESRLFTAYSSLSTMKLTFNMDNIKDLKILTKDTPMITEGRGAGKWNYIMSEDLKTPLEGFYIIACAGDMHLVYEFYKLEKGIRIWDLYSGENEHWSGWVPVRPLAFHYVPYYHEGSMEWGNFDNNIPPKHADSIISAFIIQKQEDYPNFANRSDKELSLDNSSSIIHYEYEDNFSGLFHTGSDDYSDYIKSEHTENTLAKKYLGFHCIQMFTEGHHGLFWNMREMLRGSRGW